MLTGEIRNKVDKIWTDMWAGGITNPLTVIEQLTYLMFIRSLMKKNWKLRALRRLVAKACQRYFHRMDPEGNVA
jgi:type I restriction enzyme M protein